MPNIELVATLKGHTDRVWQVSWSPSGAILASCSGDKTVRIWGKTAGDGVDQQWQCLTVLSDHHNRTIRSVSWSPCGRFLAMASFDGTSTVWEYDEASGEFDCASTLEGHENEVKSVAWDASGSLLATCSRDKSVWIWEDVGRGEFECASVLSGHTQDVKMVAWHPDTPLLASASYDDTIRIWKEDEDDWLCADTLRGHESTVWAISWNRDGSHLVSSSDDLTVRIWRQYKRDNRLGIAIADDKTFEYRNVCTLSGYHTRTIYSVDWARVSGTESELIATGAGDDSIKIFGLDVTSREGQYEGCTGEALSDTQSPSFALRCSTEKAHDSDVNHVRWNPTLEGILASAGDDNHVKIWRYVP